MKIENKQIGLVVALVLGVLMLLLPATDAAQYKINPDKITKSILTSADQVSPEDLSKMIIKGKRDYQLIDIRTPKEFKAGTIKGAVNIPLDKLFKKTTITNELSDSQMVIIFSNGNSHAHQAWVVLTTAGKDVYVLEGGYNLWMERVMNPKISDNPSDDEVLKYKTAAAVAGHFGGGGALQNVAANKTGGAAAPRGAVKKKKLKGCAN